ncbi:MAG: iron-containing alcohol dehydrogenase [Planctomycetia bacterium]|nr:iron-containing alcohol dehydrogenase [Planctomycetia bacterium]
MPDSSYDFCAPSRIVFGWGRRVEAGRLARSLGRRAFIVCGSRTLEQNGRLDEILQTFEEAGVDAVCTPTCTREPLVDDVDRLVTLLREARAGTGDLLVGIGGGSAIDLAKAAAALITQESRASVVEYLEGVGSGLKIETMPLPVLALPTTGGTGSEATRNAVISSFDPPFKISLRSELMVPRIVLVDPELSVSVPPNVTAWTGMDAITQLLESYVTPRATSATQDLAWSGLGLAVPNLVEAFNNLSSRPAREALAQAALLSGMALANSGLGMAHGVAAALGVHCSVPHGLACAVMLPTAVRINRHHSGVEAKLARAGWAMLHPQVATLDPSEVPRERDELREYDGLATVDRVDRVLWRIETLLVELNIPRRLSKIGVLREQIPAIVRDSRGNSMSGNPRALTDDELTHILEEMW